MKPKQPISPENALSRVAALCSRCEQAEADIRKKLTNWGISRNNADIIIQRLIDEKYLDEQRFARAFARDKFRFEGWGRIKIAYNLKLKHISAECIENALSLIDEEEYHSTLERILRNKLRSVSNKDQLQKKASLLRFASSRGFEPNLIYHVLPRIIDCEEDF